MIPNTVIFFGRPGAGKSTQFRLLVEHFERESSTPVLAFEWSPLIRSYVQGNTFAQKRAKALVDAGELLPSFLAPSLWLPALRDSLAEEKHLIIDGLPRHMIEAELLDSCMEFYGREGVEVIDLQIPVDTAQTRLSERGVIKGRSKDITPERIQKRLDRFASDMLPVLDFFSGRPRYRIQAVDGTDHPDAVHDTIKRSLGM